MKLERKKKREADEVVLVCAVRSIPADRCAALLLDLEEWKHLGTLKPAQERLRFLSLSAVVQ